MAVSDRNEIFEQEPQEVKCPDCGSHNLDPFDGVYYDDEELIGFRYQCNECGSQFYSDEDMTEEDIGYLDDTCCPKCEKVILVPYERDQNAQVETVISDDGTYPELQHHKDKCPNCGHGVLWWRDADSWILDDSGAVISTQWLAWHCGCDRCHGEFFIPYNDGIARAFYDDDDDEY